MNMKYTKIICILDRSGSMSSIIKDAIGGFNAFLKSQKEVEGDAYMSTILFDTDFLKVHINKNIKEVEEFTEKTYVPRGGTALYDAIGIAVENEIETLSTQSLEQRPEKTLCIILTDGEENSSRNYNRDDIKELINEMRDDFNWEFIFLAANQDATLSAEGIGIKGSNSYTFDYSNDGISVAYCAMSDATSKYRSASYTKGDTLINK